MTAEADQPALTATGSTSFYTHSTALSTHGASSLCITSLTYPHLHLRLPSAEDAAALLRLFTDYRNIQYDKSCTGLDSAEAIDHLIKQWQVVNLPLQRANIVVVIDGKTVGTGGLGWIGNPFAGAGGGGGFPFASGGGMPGGARSFHFSTGGGGNGFNFSNADDIFGEFMRSSGGGDDFDFGGFGMGGMPGGMGGMGGGGGGRKGSQFRGGRRAPEPEVTVVEKPLAVSLEELYNGTTKKLKIKRKTYDQSTGKQSTQDRILEVPIKKGLKAGSKIKFSDVGDQVEGGTQDLHFIVSEKPHAMFTREGDDVKHTIEIDLKEALTGWRRTVQTIDGKQLSVGSGGPTGPTWTERYPNLGMPKSKKPSDRGDFIVGVKIKFPTSLTSAQKEKLKEIL